MAVIWVNMPEEATKAVQTAQPKDAVMQDTSHIPPGRMLLVATQPNECMTAAEQKHIQRCCECLMVFGQVVLSKIST